MLIINYSYLNSYSSYYTMANSNNNYASIVLFFNSSKHFFIEKSFKLLN